MTSIGQRNVRRFRPVPVGFAQTPAPARMRNWQAAAVTGSASTDFNERVSDDVALVRKVASGDQEAARTLVERLRPAVVKAVHRRMPRWASEDDLVQIVFSKVFSKLHQFSGAVPLECWVTRIGLNTSLNQIAYESVRPEWRMSDLNADQEQAVHDRAEAVTDGEDRRDAREMVDLLLAHLKPEERLIVTLLHIEQRTTKEISLMTGFSIPLIKVKAFRTRRKMRRLGQKLLGNHPASLLP